MKRMMLVAMALCLSLGGAGVAWSVRSQNRAVVVASGHAVVVATSSPDPTVVPISPGATLSPGFHPRTPAYPPAERAALLAAAAELEGCMHRHGVSDFPGLPASFGDGRTAAPSEAGPSGSDMDPASAVFQQASAGCTQESAAVRQATLAANGLDQGSQAANGSAWPPMSPADLQPEAPTYPVAERPGVLAAAGALEACMHAHGVADFPALSPSYGDGRTRAPRLDGPKGGDLDPSSTTFADARNACVHSIDELHRVMLEAAGQLPR